VNREQMVEKAAAVLDQHECIFIGTVEGYACGCDEPGVLDLPGVVEAQEHQAQAVLDAILPRVTTVAEIEALPAESLVMATRGARAYVFSVHAGIACSCHWENDDKHGGRSQSRHLASLAPLTVVWQPEVTA
jgi:hypothetical protein